MTSQEAKTVAEFLVAEFRNEMGTTERVLAAVPSTQLNYRPDGKSKTGLGLLRHIALEDEWLLTCIANGEFSPPPDDSDGCGIMNPTQAVSRYKERIGTALDRVHKLSGEELAQAIDFFGFQMPRVNILATAVKHSVHHRGQLSSYLRAMGGKVPGIYGPSADTETVPAAAI